MFNCIAIDDEPLALEVIKRLSEQVAFIHLNGCFTRPMDAMSFLGQEKTDLLFLDIRMPDLTGIDFIQALPRPPMVIFTTAYSEHAVQGFELDAVDFLLKPISLARFLKACNKAYELADKTTIGTLFIKSGYEQIRVNIEEILYAESRGNYVQFVLPDRKVVSRLTMNEAVTLLPAASFIRIHRCYLVAKKHITKMDKRTAWLGKKELPIGDVFYPDIELFLKSK